MHFQYYPIGMKVRTTRSNGAEDWQPEALAARRWGVEGEIVRTHDSHGFVYEVQHDDGTKACYEPGEVAPLLEEGPGYTPAERQEMIEKMTRAANRFYGAAVDTRVHSFIEFMGLMSKFIDACQRAERDGQPFYIANAHNGKTLPFYAHDVSYLAEKLNCIYGPALLASDELRGVFINVLLDGKFRIIPVEPPTVNMALEDPYAALDGAP